MRRAWGLVLVGLALLAIGWAAAPRSALPLYDGVGFPDEPYRFVQPPAGAKPTKPPTTGRGQSAVSGSQNAAVAAASAENAPQVDIQIPGGALAVPTGTTLVTIVATPQQTLPTASGQYLWSNVYDVTATPAAATLRSGDLQAIITMRAATAQRPEPRIAYYTGGRWMMVPTFAVGRDIYEAQMTRFGRFAVIGTVPLDVSQLAGAKRASNASIIGIVAGVGALMVLVALYLIGRRRRAMASVKR